MREILPDVFHWTAVHPEIGVQVSSYFLADEGILLDPLVPKEGVAWFEKRRPREVILTNRLHERESEQFREAFGCAIHAHRAGIEQGMEIEGVEPFAFGDRLSGGIEVLEVDAICPDEAAFFIPKSGGILAFADGLVRDNDGPPGFVGDELMADSKEDAAEVKRRLRAALEKIVTERSFQHLLFAHGDPLVGGGEDALRRFLKEA